MSPCNYADSAMGSQFNSQHRAFHRVRFPIAEQPRWIIGTTRFVVVDLAEASCRLARSGLEAVEPGQAWQGNLQFPNGDQIWVEGTVVRWEADAIVVRFTKGISFQKIMSLQRELHRKYPSLRELRCQPGRLTADSRPPSNSQRP